LEGEDLARPRRASAVLEPEAADLTAFRERLRGKRAGENAHLLLLGLRVVDTASLLERIREGLSYGALERFQRNIALTTEQVAALIQINPRTLALRRSERKLAPDESDRLVRAARLFAKALALFEGDAAAAREWLAAKAPALGGETPLAVARTETGAREVENLIGRLEHGVFS
jgi:putative toxin-antitoxin system antitoxin component (TIGR02293 family)